MRTNAVLLLLTLASACGRRVVDECPPGVATLTGELAFEPTAAVASRMVRLDGGEVGLSLNLRDSEKHIVGGVFPRDGRVRAGTFSRASFEASFSYLVLRRPPDGGFPHVVRSLWAKSCEVTLSSAGEGEVAGTASADLDLEDGGSSVIVATFQLPVCADVAAAGPGPPSAWDGG